VTSGFVGSVTRWSPDGPEPPPPSTGVFRAFSNVHKPLMRKMASGRAKLQVPDMVDADRPSSAEQ